MGKQTMGRCNGLVGGAWCRLGGILSLVMALSWCCSCSSTRSVPAGAYLLDKVKIRTEHEPEDITASDLKPYLRQRPNAKILGMKLGLWLYNWARPEPRTAVGRWLHRIGDAPVIYDDLYTQQSKENLLNYLASCGFYGATVRDTTIPLGKKRKEVDYVVDFGQPTRIDSVRYTILDSTVAAYIHAADGQQLLKPGSRLDMRLLDAERKRLESLLKEQGFYHFTWMHVGFVADTLGTPHAARLELKIPYGPTSQFAPNLFYRYKVESLTVYPDYNPNTYQQLPPDSLRSKKYRGLTITYHDKPRMRPFLINRMMALRPDSLLRKSYIEQTRRNFQGLPIFQYCSFNFRETWSPRQDSSATRPLGPDTVHPMACEVYLIRNKSMRWQIEPMLTYSGSWGFSLGLSFTHQNLFQAAELLEVRFTGTVEALRKREELKFKTALEFGGSISVLYPYLILPWVPADFQHRHQPTTRFKLSYNYQRRPDYQRTLLTTNVVYSWYNPPYLRQSATPFEVGVVKMFDISPEFEERIRATYQSYSYRSQLITSSSYSLGYHRAASSSSIHGLAVNLNLEISGNILYGCFKLAKATPTQGAYQLLGLPFSQYVKGDINLAYSRWLGDNTFLVGRLYIGVGYPYGNAVALPFVKKFYEGGANGVRAWLSRDLGPGSYYENQLAFPYQTGDIKLEANLELRFPIVWKLEGALFLDAGNIWAINQHDEREGALFRLQTFYRQIALGYGAGLRVNLNFMVLRLDLGIRLHDPANRKAPGGEKHWIPFQRGYARQDFALQLGVGYPF